MTVDESLGSWVAGSVARRERDFGCRRIPNHHRGAHLRVGYWRSVALLDVPLRQTAPPEEGTGRSQRDRPYPPTQKALIIRRGLC